MRSHHGSYVLSSLAFHRATIPKSLSSERQFKYSFHKLVSCLGEHLVDHTSKKCPASQAGHALVFVRSISGQPSGIGLDRILRGKEIHDESTVAGSAQSMAGLSSRPHGIN